MSIRIKCVCGARLKAPDNSLGRSVRCSVCASAVFVPGAPSKRMLVANHELAAWIRLPCACGKVIKCPPEWAGKKGHCPRCGVEHTMPTALPSNVPGEHDAEEFAEHAEAAEAPKPLRSMVKAPPPEPVKKRTPPRPQPQPQAQSEGAAQAVAEADPNVEVEVDGRTLTKSGLLDLTGNEEVKIVDGVAPALWDAKLAQRAKAIKAGTGAQTLYYSKKLEGPGAAGVLKKIREWVRTNRVVPAAAALLVLAVASFMIFRTVRGVAAPPVPWQTVYCYDLNTGKIFAAPKTQLAPFNTDSGKTPYPQPAAFWAATFSCGSCADSAEQYVGWLEALTPDAKNAVAPFIADNPNGEPAEGMLENAISNIPDSIQIADPKDPDSWFASTDPQAARITNAVADHCKEGTAPTRCKP